MAANIMLLYGLPATGGLRADIVSGSGYGGFGCTEPAKASDGRPLGGFGSFGYGLAPARDVSLIAASYPAVIAATAGQGSVEGLGGLPMPKTWWQWALLAGAGYLVAKKLKLL